MSTAQHVHSNACPKSSTLTVDGLPEWFFACREETVFRYDMARFPFARLLADYLEVEEQSLGALSTVDFSRRTEPLNPKLAQAYKAAGVPLTPAARRCDGPTHARFCDSPAYLAFLAAYRTFIAEAVAPLCGGGEVVYQCPPTIRVVLPGAPATISLHCDRGYKWHQAGEINFWVPVTPVFGENALWLESAPGADDFQPRGLAPPEALRFNGYDCRHYTVRNDTTASRVSFDFRVIPARLCGQRGRMGEFPMEETLPGGGYITHPHPSQQRGPHGSTCEAGSRERAPLQ